jgi:hypothetical protein
MCRLGEWLVNRLIIRRDRDTLITWRFSDTSDVRFSFVVLQEKEKRKEDVDDSETF